ncbi:MAG: type secretion system protein ImpH [Acetobacteraceae bacterium]|nr:type secretion system protein ImpH [Acetobacteraceae bacterium]
MTDAPPGRSEPLARTSVLNRLLREPRRFGFDAMVRVVMHATLKDDPGAAIRFRTPPGLAFPAAEVQEVTDGAGRRDATVGLMGLTGPSGVLPRYYSEIVSQMLRGGSTALHQFLDMLGERFVAFFALAAIKYRPARQADLAMLSANPAPDAISQVLLSLTGYGTPNLTPRFAAGADALLHYAGLFAMQPRSAERLGAMLSEWLGMNVEVIEFAGAWLRLPQDQRSQIGANGVFCRLGVDAAVGMRAWSPEARMLLRVGPLSREDFQLMLPDRDALQRLVSLVRAFVGPEIGFAVNPVLGASEFFRSDDSGAMRLDTAAPTPSRLGWNTWLPIGAGSFLRRTDAAEAVFDADVVESRVATSPLATSYLAA